MKKIVTILVTFLFVVHTHAQRQDTVPDMTRDGATLKEVVIMGNNSRKDMLMKSSQSLVRIDKSEIVSSLSGSLMQSLSSIPGVKAINIGSSQTWIGVQSYGGDRERHQARGTAVGRRARAGDRPVCGRPCGDYQRSRCAALWFGCHRGSYQPV